MDVILCVVCKYNPIEWIPEGETSNHSPVSISSGEDKIVLDEASKRNDEWDDFNHPRRRRALILRELHRRSGYASLGSKHHERKSASTSATKIVFQTPTSANTSEENNDGKNPLDLYRKVHSKGLIDFLSTAWKEWDLLGCVGRDPSCVPFASLLMEDSSSDDDNGHEKERRVPPLIPCNFSLPREAHNGRNDHPQRSSKNVMGQMGYYCTDTCTPIVSKLVEELTIDASTVSTAVDIAIDQSRAGNNKTKNNAKSSAVVYALCTHPGHHAARDSFGGYCYVNNAALAARLLQERLSESLSATDTTTPRVAVLDVDYHCGNGTASIFYNDPTVLVVSIHCHPDYEYPFHSGYGDEIGGSDARGCTLHVPLLPGATWEKEYQTALRDTAGKAIATFEPDALVLSLGLDTHIDDPCATRRAGFRLTGRVRSSDASIENSDSVEEKNNSGRDYDCMGRTVGELLSVCSSAGINYGEGTGMIPTIVLQEGGYEMTAVPSAAADVLLGMAEAMAGGN